MLCLPCRVSKYSQLLFAEGGKRGGEILKEFASAGQNAAGETGAEVAIPEPPLMCTISPYYISMHGEKCNPA